MEESSKTYQLLMCFTILLATLFHGSFFSVEYILVTIVLLLTIVFSKKLYISKPTSFLLLGVVVLYYASSIFSGYDTGSAITESTKPLLLLLAVIIGTHIKKDSFMKTLIITSSVLGIIGLLSLCKIIEFNDFVYVYNGVRSLQSTMQYANSTAVVLICGIFSVRFLNQNDRYNYICIVTEIILTVCLLYTNSKIAIAVYIMLIIIEQVLLKDGISIKLIINLFGSVIIYFIMQYLINNRLSFVAFIVCIVLALLIAEKILKIEKKTIKLNRITAIILIAGIISSMVISLFFIDISTIMVRFLYYIDGAKALIQNPLLGLSPGGWGEYQYNYQSAQYFVKQVHNGFLQIGLDAGIPAMILFTFVIILALIGLIKNFIKDRQPNNLYILLIFLTLILHGFLDFDFSYGNILIILGICISYGFDRKFSIDLKISHRILAIVCTFFLICSGICETVIFLGQNEYSKGNYEKESGYYSFVLRLKPYDIDTNIMYGLCQTKLGDKEYENEIIKHSYDKHSNNWDIILKAMDMAVNNNDFASYSDYQNQLLICAPMQQNTYVTLIKHLDTFFQKGILDELLYLKEKNKVISTAIDINSKMSKFNQYLDFGAEIDINSLK